MDEGRWERSRRVGRWEKERWLWPRVEVKWVFLRAACWWGKQVIGLKKHICIVSVTWCDYFGMPGRFFVSVKSVLVRLHALNAQYKAPQTTTETLLSRKMTAWLKHLKVTYSNLTNDLLRTTFPSTLFPFSSCLCTFKKLSANLCRPRPIRV